MASTKEMQARAKARRKTQNKPQRHINEHKFTELMIQFADVILKENPLHGYGQSDLSLYIAKQIIQHHSLGRSDFDQLISYRERFEQALTKKYGIDLACGVDAFLQDQEAHLKDCEVPQHIRVMCGLMDTLISVLAVRSGAIKFNFV